MHFIFAFVFAGAFIGLALGFVIEEPEEWPRAFGTPATAPPAPNTPDLCKKDLLILLDASYSIGKSDFDKKIKPFLIKLVNSPKLNVAPDGTQFSLVTFSDDRNTQLRFNFGAYNTPQALEDYINDKDRKGLDYNRVSGGRTFTGKAAEIADTQVFPKSSPLNARSNIADVVMILTDGEPRGKRRNDQLNLALQHTSSMKKKDILIVGIAVGPQRDKFKDQIIKMSTNSSMVFDAEFDDLDKIIDNVVDASCTPFKPGDCSCPMIVSKVEYVKPSKTAVSVEWPTPTLQCKNNRVPNLKPTVSPIIQSPHDFPVGKQDIVYTYTFKGGFDLECRVKIVVKSCTCPSRSPVVAYVSSNAGSTKVNWNEPVPNCSATLKSRQPDKPSGSSFTLGSQRVDYVYSTVGGFDLTCSVDIEVRKCFCQSNKMSLVMKPDSPNGQVSVNWIEPKPNCPNQKIVQTTTTPPNIKPGASFGVGKHTVTYVYEMSSGMRVQCSAEIDVKVVPCQGVDYDPAIKLCCCGKLQNKKPGYKCCGRKVYDSTKKTCCPMNYNIADDIDSCPTASLVSV